MKRLLLSVHDVTPRHFARLKTIHAMLGELGVGHDYAMLVVPDFWRAWPLEEHGDFTAWLRQRAEAGVEMILHGYSHRDENRHASPFKRWKARTLTAREGEFYGLDQRSAAQRLRAGGQKLQQCCGFTPQGFVAPAWLYSRGTRAALAAEGFGFAEDHWRVWSPARRRTLCRGPVISYASRSPGRIRSSLLWSRLAGRLLQPLPVLRLAIHPHDLDSAVLHDEIRRTIEQQLRQRRLCRYAQLAA